MPGRNERVRARVELETREGEGRKKHESGHGRDHADLSSDDNLEEALHAWENPQSSFKFSSEIFQVKLSSEALKNRAD